MSNKGAIKKVDPKNGSVVPTQRKSKRSTVNEDTVETSKDLRHAKMSQLSEHKGDRDTKSKVSRVSLSDKKERTTTRDGTRVSESKSLSSKSSTSKSNVSSSTSVRGTAMKSTASSRAKLEAREHGVKKVASSSSSSTLEKKEKKSKDKSAKGYSEKRGLSTIFIPKTTTERLSSKSTEKSMQSTRDKEKLSTTRLPDNTKARSSSKTRSNSKTRRKSRTLSPSEVKVLHSQILSAKNREAVESDVSKEAETPIADENEYSYEDDFEDYESDFQECSDSEVSEESDRSKNSLDLDPIELRSKERQKVVHSAENRKQEEDHMHDSGHYELAEARKRAARIESMIVNRPKTPELRQPVNKAYSEDRPSESKSLPSSTDEGFEDSRSGDFKSPPLSQISYIDFRKPKETELINESQKQQENKPTNVKKTRGQELLEMIKLDTMEWSLLECSPVPYEEFIRTYGKLNTQQTYSQTGEDNLDVEVQTEEIPLQNKWTQFPIACRKELRSKEDIDMFKMEQIGVGSDEVPGTLNTTVPPIDVLKLNEFVNRAGRVMLSLLEERKSGGTVFRKDNQDLPFSEGYVKLSVDSVTFLAGRSVSMIHYSDVFNKVLLTIHLPVEEEIETSSKQDYVTDCCIGCVWNISEPSMPTKLFYSPSPITACCFHLTNYNIVFAGLEDGSISLWDLREDEMWHQHVTDKDNNMEWTVRTATYTTAGSIESEEHRSRVVAIRVLSKIETKFLQRSNNNFVPIQICSLDNDGFVIIWSILSNMGISIDDLGLSQWGDIRLVRSDVIPLQPDDVRNKDNISAFLDLRVDSVDNNNLYIATNTTNVLHASYIGNRTNPPMYRMNEDDPSGVTACIETCPFRKSFFLVGCDDGTVRLHAVNTEKPILQLKDQHCQTGAIKSVQWSKTKPFTIYILDNKSQIRVWDLSVSDLQPVHTVSTENLGRVTCIQLSPCRTEQDMTNQYLALGTCTGAVEIHKLNTNFYYSKKEDLSREINIFAKYVAVW